MVFGFGKKAKKSENYPYKVNDDPIIADGRGRFSSESLSKLYNNPSYVYPEMSADTYALSENREVTVLRSGEGYMFFYNRNVDQWAKADSGTKDVTSFLDDLNRGLGKEKIAVAIHEADFDALIKDEKGKKCPHAIVADRLLQQSRSGTLDKNSTAESVTINKVHETIGIHNLGAISEGYRDGYVSFSDRQESEHAVVKALNAENTTENHRSNGGKSLDELGFSIGANIEDIKEL